MSRDARDTVDRVATVLYSYSSVVLLRTCGITHSVLSSFEFVVRYSYSESDCPDEGRELSSSGRVLCVPAAHL